MVLEKTLESPLDCKEFQPVHPKGDQSRVFIRGTDVGAETHRDRLEMDVNTSEAFWKDSLEGLMLKLKLLYFDHLMQRADSLEKTLMLGKIEGK